MAKGKYEKWIEKDNLLRLQAWARDGLTDEQIAKNIGITAKTLYEWKKKYSKICEALKKGKEVVDVEVENSLYRAAVGFHETVRKTVMKKTVTYKDGKRIKEESSPVTVEEDVYVKPDVLAQMFWLKNRKPDVWRDKKDIKVEGELSITNALKEARERVIKSEQPD